MVVVAAGVLGAACDGEPSAPSGPPAELTALPRQLTASERQVLDASNAFSFALWSRLNAVQPDSNVFVSPLSASFALGMTMNGAANQTFTEMRSALQFGSAAQHDINEGYRSLIALLTSFDPTVTTQIANSIWYRNDFTFNQTFFDTVKTYFNADVSALNFADAPAALATINGWVKAKTNGRIPAILDQIADNSVMFLINAIYFKAGWREKFDPAKTVDAEFTPSTGATQAVKLMRRTGDMNYGESATWQGVDVPYGNAAYAMTVLLPKPGVTADALAATLTPAVWQSIVATFNEREIDLSFPRLTLTYERALNDDLKALGMNVPFIGDVADFTRMSPAGDHLYISKVKQKAFVAIDEEGTEAAAATSVEIGVTSAPIIPIMRVDHPYIFVIRERLSGTIMFMGKISRMPS
jgi:serpin B